MCLLFRLFYMYLLGVYVLVVYGVLGEYGSEFGFCF